jgi:CHAT domain-containing protein
MLLVGNPDFEELNRSMATKLVPLPGTQHEIETILQVIGTENVRSYMGAQATRAQFTQAIGEAEIVHVATHGVMHAQRPWEAFLAFSGATGKLSLREISALKTSADLVVLSACDTGRGKVLEGEGVWGFQAQFLAAGAKNVVASLWRVGDDSTAQFMANFYRTLSSTSKSYAATLRQAKLDLMANEQWRHPRFWAPFILYGAP